MKYMDLHIWWREFVKDSLKKQPQTTYTKSALASFENKDKRFRKTLKKINK